MRQYRKISIKVIVNFVILLFLSEILGVIVYYWKHHAFFYTHKIERSEMYNIMDDKLRYNSKLTLHPILGFIRRPKLPMSIFAPRERINRLYRAGVTPKWADMRANNFGFFSRQNYPYNPDKKSHYVIGIFGGSVAQWFSLQGADRLIEKLQELPLFQNKKIVVLNFAQGGFKQPQQLQTLTYFLTTGQKFDFVLNIDGFNEIALSQINYKENIDLSMPSAQHILPILSLIDKTSLTMDQVDSLYNILHYKQSLRTTEDLALKSNFASVYIALRIYYDQVNKKYLRSIRQFEQLSTTPPKGIFIHLNKSQKVLSNHKAFMEITDIWMNSSTLMSGLLRNLGIPYLQIVQPNQYYSSKKFSFEEQKSAISEMSPYKWAIENGYIYLLDKIPILNKKGVNIFSAVHVFDNITDTIYSDNCCHYNQLGNEVLANFIAELIVPIINTDPGAAPDDYSTDAP